MRIERPEAATLKWSPTAADLFLCLAVPGACKKAICTLVKSKETCIIGINAERKRLKKAEKRMNKRKMASFRKMLEEQRDVLEKQYKDLEEGNLACQSDFSGEMPFEEEYAASGTSTFERERDLSLCENVKDILKRVNEAIDRIDNGTFGICELCGGKILEERLEALPYASLCILCKQKEEKALR
jgi:RNA polymerase-binding transcription factor DksA